MDLPHHLPQPVVQCGEIYHIRLALADGSDANLDSWVFLEAGSFSSNGSVRFQAELQIVIPFYMRVVMPLTLHLIDQMLVMTLLFILM